MNVLSVVIPAYNEEQGLAEVIERTLSVHPRLSQAGIDMELIVVDDGSHDGTANVAARYPDVRLIRHPTNRGYGAALKTGFHHAQGNLLSFLDADGTYPPESFPELCQAIVEGEADLVIGSRMAGAESHMPGVRRVGNFLFANLLSLLSNHRVTDSSSGMRVMRREILPQLYPLPDGLNFTPVMSTRALHEEVRWQEVPIPYRERAGRSKLNAVRDGVRFLHTILWTALNYNPVRILGLLGMGLLAIAAVIGIGITAARLAGVTSLGPWGVVAVFLASLCAVSGVTLFALGATFNYLVSLFHHRPVRQGLFGRPIFRHPLDRHFGWMGGLGMLAGLAVGTTSLGLSLGGWSMERLWLYLLGAAMLLLVGLQLTVFWIIMRVLEELSYREIYVARDLEAGTSGGHRSYEKETSRLRRG